jgi:hypothetical protein
MIRVLRPASRALSLSALLALVVAACHGHDEGHRFPPAGAAEPVEFPPAAFAKPRRGDAVDVVIVREADGWLLPSAIPAAAHLEKAGTVSLVVVGSPPSEQAVQLLERLRPRRVLAFRSAADTSLARGIEKLRGAIISCGEDPSSAAVRLARRAWKTIGTVVFAGTDDAEGALMGSLLASHLGVPFVPVEPKEARRQIARALRVLGAKGAIAVADQPGRIREWRGIETLAIRKLDSAAVQAEIVRRLVPAQIRNLILTRSPTEGGEPAWLAPWLSVARRAPVVLTHQAGGAESEATVAAFVKAHGLRPKTITILGDYTSIGTVRVADPKRLGEYEVEIEPCSGAGQTGAATYGVGRLPLSSVRETSQLIAATLARDRVLAKRRFRALLIANPSTDYGPLPLCETVSRVTGEEFLNARVALSAFYGRRADDPQVVEAAKPAHLIVFEGHISDQFLFTTPVQEEPQPLPDPGPVFQEDGALTRPPPEDDPIEPPALDEPPIDEVPGEGVPPDAIEPAQPPPARPPAEPELPAEEPEPAQEEPEPHPPDPNAPNPFDDQWGNEGPGDPPPADVPPGDEPQFGEAPPTVPQTPLEGMPLVVLQSCHSLEETTARVIFQRGGVGLLGSVTNIHSASGSSFIKQFCDGALYRGDTAGEALRDSRNYFLCLAKLKAERGHQQQAKVTRVALSFRLWGDPEMRVVHRDLARPKRTPVSIAWAGPDKVAIQVPGRRLPKCATEKYSARMFPGSQAAGVVKSAKGKTQRRLMPFYFGRLDVPVGFEDRGFGRIGARDAKGPRSVFLVDDARQRLFVVHFPDKEKAGETVVLPFVR